MHLVLDAFSYAAHRRQGRRVRAVVLGLGQRYAGDDAVGLAVAEVLRARGVDARPVHDASALVELAPAYDRVVVVDAVTGGGDAGQVLTLDPEAFAQAKPLSSHGLSVLDALGGCARAARRRGGGSGARGGRHHRGPGGAVRGHVRRGDGRGGARRAGGDGAVGGDPVHESSLARNVLDLVLARAEGARVVAVRGRVCETERLSVASVGFHFAALARETVAEGARLELAVLHARARCRVCGVEYLPEHHVLMCPACGDLDGEALDATGVWVDAIEVEAR
jgi:hydrogenase nickel incorporation protein HypA/HybF